MLKIKTYLFYYNFCFTLFLLTVGVYTRSIFSSPQLLLVVIPLLVYFVGYLITNVFYETVRRLGQTFWVTVSLLLLFNFLSSGLVFILNIIYTRSPLQLVISLFYLPYPLYFFLTIFNWYQKLKPTVPSKPTVPVPEAAKVVDHNRRQFLKLVGATSLSLALISLFNPKKASAAFFGSVPGPGTVALKDSDGNKINPAEKQPTDGYKISQVDDTGSSSYYGFVDPSGNWYIMREESTGDFRYSRGSSAFSTNWTNRSSLTYDYFDNVF